MANCSYQLPDDLLMKLSTLADKTDEIVPKVLEAGAEVVLKKAKSNLQASIGRTKYKSRSTGELLSALGVSPAKQDRDGNFNVKIGFSEPRKNGQANAKIGTILEYGKHGQPPRPFMKPAKSAAKAECISAMEGKFDEEVSQI